MGPTNSVSSASIAARALASCGVVRRWRRGRRAGAANGAEAWGSTGSSPDESARADWRVGQILVPSRLSITASEKLKRPAVIFRM